MGVGSGKGQQRGSENSFRATHYLKNGSGDCYLGQEKLLKSSSSTSVFRVQGFSLNSRISLWLLWYILRLSLLVEYMKGGQVQGLCSPPLRSTGKVSARFLLSGGKKKKRKINRSYFCTMLLQPGSVCQHCTTSLQLYVWNLNEVHKSYLEAHYFPLLFHFTPLLLCLRNKIFLIIFFF